MKKYLAILAVLTSMGALDAIASNDTAGEAAKTEAKAQPKPKAKEEAKDEPHTPKKCFKICMEEIDDRDKCNLICFQTPRK